MIVFAIYLVAIITIFAVPGFCYFHFARDTSFGVSIFVGIITGIFLTVALDPIAAIFGLLKKKIPKKPAPNEPENKNEADQ